MINPSEKFGSKEEFIKQAREKTYKYEVTYHGCAQALVKAFLDLLEINNPELFKSATGFSAGLALTGNNCGALLGGLMILSMKVGRGEIEEGVKGIVGGIRPMRALMKWFEEKYQSYQCSTLTGGATLADPEEYKRYEEAGGLEKCAGILAETAAKVAELIYE